MSDPSTLLQATTCVCGFSALAIWSGVRFLDFSREAGRDWAWANVLFGLGSLLTVVRGDWPNSVLYATADSFELVGFACLHAGLLRFLGEPPPVREHGWVVGLAVSGVFAGYLAGLPLLRLTIYCTAAAWLLGRAAFTTYRGLREEFGAKPSAVVTAPIAIASLLQVSRGVGGLIGGGGAFANPLQPTQFNMVLMWAAFSIVLLLNFAVAGFASARQMARIRELTLRDSLTDVMNRRALEALLRHELANWRRRGVPLAVVYLDLDHFKALNDRYGHAAGDQALRHVSAVIGEACRDGDTLARIGGEEFCVLLPHTEVEGASLMAERMRSKLEATPFPWENDRLTLTASFGVATAVSQDDSPAEILRRADEAMYQAKRGGRNRVFTAPAPAAAEPEAQPA